ncbi:MAG: alpha/beta fold hydrolase [archaeon]
MAARASREKKTKKASKKKSKEKGQRYDKLPHLHISQRKLFSIIFFGTAGLVVILTLLFLLGINVSFFLQDELVLFVDTSTSSLAVDHREPVVVNVSVKLETALGCSSRCNITLVGASDRDVGPVKTFIIKPDGHVDLEYSLMPPPYGYGQDIYLVLAQCANIPTAFCPTDSEPHRDTAMITLNYRLSDAEQAEKAAASPQIEVLLMDIADAGVLVREASILLSHLPDSISEKADLIRRAESVDGAMVVLKNQLDEKVALWDRQAYLELGERFGWSGLISSTYDVLLELGAISNEAFGLLVLRDEQAEMVSTSLLHKDVLARAIVTFETEGFGHASEFVSLDSAISEILDVTKIMLDGKNASEWALHDRLLPAADHLVNWTDAWTARETDGRARLLLAQALLSEHQGSQFSPSVRLSCLAAKNISIQAYSLNSGITPLVIIMGNETVDNGTVAGEVLKVESRLLMQAHDKVFAYLNSSTLPDRAALLRSLASLPYPSPEPLNDSYDLSHDQLIPYAHMHMEFSDNFLAEHCSPVPAPIGLSNIYDFLSFDDSGVDFLHPDLSLPMIQPPFPESLTEHVSRCCVSGRCEPCCEEDCESSENPILFIHGHAFNEQNTPEFSMGAFAEIQELLMSEGLTNAGVLDLSDQSALIPANDWGRHPDPVTVRATYYYILQYPIGGYVLTAQKSERIENYAIRLRELVLLLKDRTGRPKVNIVAHSMGGLVAREYLAIFGGADIDKLILVNTPNHGVAGKVRHLCGVLGSPRECDDMTQGSVFLSRLDSRPLPSGIEVHNIRSTGCKMDEGAMGDGIVTLGNAYLGGAIDYVVEGICTDTFKTNLHTEALDPQSYPAIYGLIRDILLEPADGPAIGE